MDISFRELQKRDVINVPDGKNLGRITDLVLDFPRGVMTGIYVPGKKQGIFSRIFSRTEIFIDRSHIVKIGGDVILVDIRSVGGNNGVSVDKKPCPKPPHKPQNPCENLFGGCDNLDKDFDEHDY